MDVSTSESLVYFSSIACVLHDFVVLAISSLKSHTSCHGGTCEGILLFPRDPSIQIIPTLGHKVCKLLPSFGYLDPGGFGLKEKQATLESTCC